MGTNKVLHTKDLAIGYIQKKESYALHTGIDLHLNKGELVCLVGPNGSGKSTLLRTIAGLQAPISGEIFIEGTEISSISVENLAKLRSVVLTSKFDAGYFTVQSVVEMGRYPHLGWLGKPQDEDKAVVEKALQQTGLWNLRTRILTELSDGELQRTMVAKALAQTAPVILLDEPTAHLDLPNRVSIMKLLQELAKETGTAIVLSTHELDLAMQSADRFWLITGENDIASGLPEELALSGAIEKAFNSDNVHFDKHSGMFVMHRQDKGNVNLQGTGAGVFWTQKALERNGFRISDNQAIATIFVDEHATLWNIESKKLNESFKSLAELIEKLDKSKM